MLGKKGTAGPTFTLSVFKTQRNPIVDLPSNAMKLLKKNDTLFINTFTSDHLDKKLKIFYVLNKYL
jgi:hypothetical protein